MTATWLPVEGGIVPQREPAGPTQEEERFATLGRALEDARGEYRLRRLEAAEEILSMIVDRASALPDHRYQLLVAAAYSLQGRIHWRRAERAQECGDESVAEAERNKQVTAFRRSIVLFRAHESAIPEDLESRLCTDFAIALFRAGDIKGALARLLRAQETGVMAADSFAYLGLAYGALNEHRLAVTALKKGLQLSPGDKVLLEALAQTLADNGETEQALRTYCRAAVAAGKEDDLFGARRLLRTALELKENDSQALSMLVLLLRSQGEDEAARQVLDSLLQTHPTDPWALGLRAMILRDAGDVNAALADFRRVRVDGRDLAWVLIEQAKTLGATDAPTARKLLKKAGRFLGDTDPRLTQARVQLEMQIARANVAGLGRMAVDWLRVAAENLSRSEVLRNIFVRVGPATALDRLREFAKSETEQVSVLRDMISRWPDEPGPREALARVLLDGNDPGKAREALAVLDGVAEADSDRASLLELKGRAHELTGDPAGAIRCYRRAVRAAPKSEDAFNGLIGALTRLGRSDEALIEAEHRLVLLPGHGPALATKGRLLADAGQYQEAIKALEEAERLITGAPRLAVRMQLARAWHGIGRYGETLAVLERACDEDNDLADAHAHRAARLIEIARYQDAADVLELAIKRIPADCADPSKRTRLGWLWSARGWALRHAGATPIEQLTSIFRTAVSFNPGDPYPQKNLGWALLHQPDGRDDGERLVRELIENGGNRSVPRELVGWCHFMLKQYEAAEHWLRGVVADDPSDIPTRFDLALTLLAMRREEARKVYESAAAEAGRMPVERQRGLLHIALADLADAAAEERIAPEQLQDLWPDLCAKLRETGISPEQLGRIKERIKDRLPEPIGH